MATIVLSGISFEGRHGATAAERRSTRRFEVDVELTLSLDQAQTSDRLADTVDFRAIADVVVELGVGRPYHLLEALVDAMANALGKLAPNAGIAIELRKLVPPYCAGNPAYSAVRLSVPARS